jgi:hypothetical protein
VRAFRDAARLGEGIPLYQVTLAYGLAVAGEHEEARALVDDLQRRIADGEFIWPLGMALAHAYLGDENTALDFLEQAYEDRVGWMLMIGREPALDILRDAPRFKALASKIGPRM